MDDGSKEYSLFLNKNADQLALDLENRKLYWSNGKKWYRTGLDEGRIADEVFQADLSSRLIVNLLVSREKTYWIDYIGNIKRSNPDGSQRGGRVLSIAQETQLSLRRQAKWKAPVDRQ